MNHGDAPQPARAVLFDAYGTLFDVYSVALLANCSPAERLACCGATNRSVHTHLSMSGRYQPFWALTRAGLRFACALRLEPGAGRHRGAADEPVPPPSAFPEPRRADLQGAAGRHPPQRRPRHAGRGGEERRPGLLQTMCCRWTACSALQDRPGRLRAREARSAGPGARDILFMSATAGTPSAPPGSATPRCGSTAALRRWNSSDRTLPRTGISLRDVLAFLPTHLGLP